MNAGRRRALWGYVKEAYRGSLRCFRVTGVLGNRMDRRDYCLWVKGNQQQEGAAPGHKLETKKRKKAKVTPCCLPVSGGSDVSNATCVSSRGGPGKTFSLTKASEPSLRPRRLGFQKKKQLQNLKEKRLKKSILSDLTHERKKNLLSEYAL